METVKEIVRPLDAMGKPMLTVEDVCSLLGVSRSWVVKQCSPQRVRRIIPYRKIGRRIWFVAEQIAEWNTERRF
jgi:predicted DNA-binding transcriptional regulator AlpA